MIEIQHFVEMNPWTALVLAGALWFGLQFALSIAVRRYRDELHQLIGAAKESRALSTREVEYLDHLWLTAFAVRSTIILSVVYVLALLMPRDALLREHREMMADCPAILRDSSMDRLIDCHFISIFAANPIFGVVCIALRWSWRLKVVYLRRSLDEGNHYVAMPLMEAAHRA